MLDSRSVSASALRCSSSWRPLSMYCRANKQAHRENVCVCVRACVRVCVRVCVCVVDRHTHTLSLSRFLSACLPSVCVPPNPKATAQMHHQTCWAVRLLMLSAKKHLHVKSTTLSAPRGANRGCSSTRSVMHRVLPFARSHRMLPRSATNLQPKLGDSD